MAVCTFTIALLSILADIATTVALGGVSHFIITALPQHFSSSISQMQRAPLHGDWGQWPQHETEHLQEGGSLECDFTPSSCKSCVYLRFRRVFQDCKVTN